MKIKKVYTDYSAEKESKKLIHLRYYIRGRWRIERRKKGLGPITGRERRNQKLEGKIVETGAEDRYAVVKLGNVQFDKSGWYAYIIRPYDRLKHKKGEKKKIRETLMYLRAVRFELNQ